MANEFKKDPVLILRMDGEDLKEFIESLQFETEAKAIFSRLGQSYDSLHKCFTMALDHLSVDLGMPPPTDPWVYGNIIEPSLQSFPVKLDQLLNQETFLEEFKKLVNIIIQRLHEHPVIVAHSENTYNGSGIRRLLSNNFELNKLLDLIWRELAKDQCLKLSKECVHLAIDKLASAAELPAYGTCSQVDAVINETIEMFNINTDKILHEGEFKKTITEILESLNLRLGANPISASTNLVIDEPLASSPSPMSE